MSAPARSRRQASIPTASSARGLHSRVDHEHDVERPERISRSGGDHRAQNRDSRRARREHVRRHLVRLREQVEDGPVVPLAQAQGRCGPMPRPRRRRGRLAPVMLGMACADRSDPRYPDGSPAPSRWSEPGGTTPQSRTGVWSSPRRACGFDRGARFEEEDTERRQPRRPVSERRARLPCRTTVLFRAIQTLDNWIGVLRAMMSAAPSWRWPGRRRARRCEILHPPSSRDRPPYTRRPLAPPRGHLLNWGRSSKSASSSCFRGRHTVVPP